MIIKRRIRLTQMRIKMIIRRIKIKTRRVTLKIKSKGTIKKSRVGKKIRIIMKVGGREKNSRGG